MQDSSRPVTGYPVQNLNGCAPPPPASSATAYPYVNPNPYPYYPPPTPQNPRPTFFRRLFVAFAILVIIFGTILLIFWLVLRPHLPDFSLESLSLSNFNASNQRVTATWNAQFQVFNPNKKLSISYGDVVSSVFHKDYFLTETRIGPFVQGTRNVSTVQASYSVVDSYVEAKVVDAINGERSRGEVKFSVNVLADVAFRYGGWRGRRRVLRVRCNDVALSGSSGKMTGGPRKCSERMAKRRLTTVNPTAYCTAFPFMFIAKGKRRKEEQIV
ncbi:Late embryogenesis abundant protein [Theobroma cacao]|nr:Late embryogenesis abundant protein [Theobroma cacao]